MSATNTTQQAYSTYVFAFDERLRAARGLPVADRATKIKGLFALVAYLDAMVASGRGADCRVTISFDGGEPSITLSAADRRAKALSAIALAMEEERLVS